MSTIDIRVYFSTIAGTEEQPPKSICQFTYLAKDIRMTDTHPNNSVVRLQLDQILYLIEDTDEVINLTPKAFSKIYELRDLDEYVYSLLAGTSTNPDYDILVAKINSEATKKGLTLRIFK